MMESGREWRHPYTLSNFDLVTQSFTLMAGTRSSFLAAISRRRCTPVVVSSLTPFQLAAIFVHFSGLTWIDSRINLKIQRNSGLLVESGSGSVPSLANFA